MTATITAPPTRSRASRRAWAAWGLGAGAYAVAVFQRSSLGVAGLAAARHFDVGPAALALFTMLQLLVYAALQIPVGLLVDRVGSRRMLSIGLVLMAVGQLGFAYTDWFPAGVAARAGGLR